MQCHAIVPGTSSTTHSRQQPRYIYTYQVYTKEKTEQKGKQKTHNKSTITNRVSTKEQKSTTEKAGTRYVYTEPGEVIHDTTVSAGSTLDTAVS